MSKATCGQVLVLPSRRLVRPATDDDFFKLLYSLQNCFMPLKKIFAATIVLWKKVMLSCLKMNLKYLIN